MKSISKIAVFVLWALVPCVPATAADVVPATSVLITNANVFDGEHERLAAGMSVLVEGNKIATPYEALKIAMHDNGQLLRLSGPRDPYPDGELGVVKEGAYADLLLVDGNPLEKLDLVADPARNFVVIMKDGKIYKNTIR